MEFFSASVTARGRSRFDTQTRDESISPGVKAGSGTVQNPLDLSMSTLRQCCADAKLVRTNKLISTLSGSRIESLLLLNGSRCTILLCIAEFGRKALFADKPTGIISC